MKYMFDVMKPHHLKPLIGSQRWHLIHSLWSYRLSHTDKRRGGPRVQSHLTIWSIGRVTPQTMRKLSSPRGDIPRDPQIYFLVLPVPKWIEQLLELPDNDQLIDWRNCLRCLRNSSGISNNDIFLGLFSHFWIGLSISWTFCRGKTDIWMYGKWFSLLRLSYVWMAEAIFQITSFTLNCSSIIWNKNIEIISRK